MLKTIAESICAGIMIAIGGSVFLACDSRYAGAVFFSVALLCICYRGYYLFTGKIGFLVQDFTLKNGGTLLTGLLGNMISVFALGRLLRCAIPELAQKADTICAAKLLQAAPQTLVRGIFCGILMYLAVAVFKENRTPLGIVFCVPVFILSGFEHSIADMFYFGISHITDGRAVTFILIVILGNAVGGVLLPLLTGIGGKKNAK